MKLHCALGAVFLLATAVPAAAQVYPGQEVTVNPGAFGRGYLLYPGGKYGRNVGVLRQPGERAGGVRLHPPSRHPVARRGAAPAQVASVAPPPARTRPAPPPPAATPPASSDITALPENSASRLLSGSAVETPPARPAPAPAPTRRAPPPAAASGDAAIPFSLGGPPARIASTTPPPARTIPPATPGLKKHSVIPFAIGASSPAGSDVNAVHQLATALNAALGAGATRVQLQAYGGPRGDKSSDSRRLSLKRALVIRELLIEDGVPSEKIDVRAMGGADDNGAADRVDVFVRA